MALDNVCASQRSFRTAMQGERGMMPARPRYLNNGSATLPQSAKTQTFFLRRMAELAIGAVGLAGLIPLFNTCLDILCRVESYKDFQKDDFRLHAQFKAIKHRFERWGEAVGLDGGGKIARHHHVALNDRELVSIVQGLIQAIADTLSHQAINGVEAPAGLHIGITPGHNAPSTNSIQNYYEIVFRARFRKVIWAAKGKEGRTQKLRSLDELVSQLESLIPVMNAGEIRQLKSWLLDGYTPLRLYESLIEKKVPDTCHWLLKRSIFRDWMSSKYPGDDGKVLWVHGPPGFGKTMLCASVIQHISAGLDTPVSYFFLSSNAEGHGDPFLAVQTWVWQLGRAHHKAFDLLRGAWKSQSNTSATRKEVLSLLHEILRQVPGCTLILDGLDECTGTSGKDDGRKAIDDFVTALSSIMKNTSTRVAIFSRNENRIRSKLTNFSEHQITPEDVRGDTERVSSMIVDERVSKKSDENRMALSQMMADRCDGQFLWLEMQRLTLKKSMKAQQFYKAIQSTPRGYDDIYLRDCKAINHLHGRKRRHALCLLQLVFFATRPLTVAEISEAVLMNDKLDRGQFPADELPRSIDQDYVDKYVTGLCGSLLQVSRSSNKPVAQRTVRLTHFTVREYLLLNNPFGSSFVTAPKGSNNECAGNVELAKLCLRYILCTRIWDDSDANDAGITIGHFRNYAAGSWYKHFSQGTPDNQITEDQTLLKLVADLFRERDLCWHGWRAWYDVNKDGLTQEEVSQEVSPPSPLYYAIKIGLQDITLSMIRENQFDPAARSTLGRTALHACCSTGNAQVVAALVKMRGILSTLTYEETRSRTTPLQQAAWAGYVDVVKLLLEFLADPNVKNSGAMTPLAFACRQGHLDIVKLLSRHGARIDIRDQVGGNDLTYASEQGHFEVVKYLLIKGADANAATVNGWTPVNLASWAGHLEVVKLLYVYRADLETPSNNGWSPLSSAAWAGHSNVVRFLPDKGADPEKPGTDGRVPLYIAASGGHTQVVEVLLEKKLNLDLAVKQLWTPLMVAVAKGHADIFSLLLRTGARLDIRGTNGWTPLHIASAEGRVEMLNLVMQAGADVDLTTDDGSTPLTIASEVGNIEIVKFLLEKSAKSMASNKFRSTPLIRTKCGHVGLVTLLHNESVVIGTRDEPKPLHSIPKQGTLIDAANKKGHTALMAASANGYFDVVKILLDHGASVELKDALGWEALHYASRHGHFEIVKILLKHSADMGSTTSEGWTPLTAASAAGSLDIVNLLLEQGASIESASASGTISLHTAAVSWIPATPLLVAASAGHRNVVEVLLSSGADVTSIDYYGKTALHFASGSGSSEVVQALLQRKGVNINALDNLSWTPLFQAARCGHSKIVDMLLKDERTEVNMKDWYGSSAIFAAVRNGHSDVVKLLLPRGGTSSVPLDGFGKTLIWWAKRTGKEELVELLLEHFKQAGVMLVSEPDPLQNSSMPFDASLPFCDACLRSVVRDFGYHCTICNEGNYDICAECYAEGVKCRGESHELVPWDIKAPLSAT